MVNDALDLKSVYDGLTAKQRATLDLIADGRTHKEIAYELGIGKSATGTRIDALRTKFGGVTKAELGRIHREYREKSDREKLPRETNRLPGDIDTRPLPPRHRGESEMVLADSAPAFRLDAPWHGLHEPHVVPEVLDGEDAATNRWVTVLKIAAGILAVAILMLAAAQAIGSLQ